MKKIVEFITMDEYLSTLTEEERAEIKLGAQQISEQIKRQHERQCAEASKQLKRDLNSDDDIT